MCFLTVNVVEVLGREKALDLYKKTQEVERDGGMMVLVSLVTILFALVVVQ